MQLPRKSNEDLLVVDELQVTPNKQDRLANYSHVSSKVKRYIQDSKTTAEVTRKAQVELAAYNRVLISAERPNHNAAFLSITQHDSTFMSNSYRGGGGESHMSAMRFTE